MLVEFKGTKAEFFYFACSLPLSFIYVSSNSILAVVWKETIAK